MDLVVRLDFILMSIMKILHTTPTLDAAYGGPSTCTYYLLKGLNRYCHADVVALTNQQGKPCLWKDDFIKSLSYDAKTPLMISKNFRNFLNNNVVEYDVVHANTIWTAFSHCAKVSALELGKPFVLSPHGMLYPQALRVSAWKKKLILPLFQRKDLEEATCLHATCMQELEHIRNFGLKNPVCVVPNCLNISKENIKDRIEVNTIRRIGFVGRVNRIKNINRLIVAWHQLGDRTKEAELIIVGNGDAVYMKELQDYVSMHNMTNVRFTGFLTGNNLTDMVRSFDFQVLPSESENFGMVVPEALVNRVPVIASKGTPWEDLNIQKCGWWVDNDVDTLSATLDLALSLSETDRIEMGERGRDLVLEYYSIDKVAKDMCSVYAYLLGNGTKPAFVYD